MRTLKTLFAAYLLLLQVSMAQAQNWMMAQQYATVALDSAFDSKKEEAIDFITCKYTHFTYNPVIKEYSLYLHDTFTLGAAAKDVTDSTSSSAVIFVNLDGGIATFFDKEDNSVEFSIPDWSNSVFLWNGTGSAISFSLSCDDSEFSSYNLGVNSFSRYDCNSAEYVYIKINTVVGESTVGSIHYKLSKGKGYKVQYDSEGKKFEVYSDDRVE